MKLSVFLLTLILLTSCSQSPNDNANAKAERAAKNKETATKNEMIRLVEMAQEIEKEGREMEFFRKSQISIDSGVCAKNLAPKTARLVEFQKRMDAMPENYKSKLVTIFENLQKCLACDKKAFESCKTSRATINQVIKEVFP